MILKLPSHWVVPLAFVTVLTGSAMPAMDDFIDERVNLCDYLGLHPDRSVLIRVEGESMVDAGIHAGDLLIVERGTEAKYGDVVVTVDAGQFTIKLVSESNPNLHLVSKELIPSDDGFAIWGVVKFAIHKI